ncbi:MAG: WD40 repeat domain-containing protein [Anaerolineaceae bacterium]|nr:WD40 repeat domain-containing protein [Anaerolineaceae bacterium]
MKHLRYMAVLFIGLMLTFAVGTALAQDGETNLMPITVENAADITELAVLGRGTGFTLAWSPDSSLLAVGTTIGVWLYDSTDLAAEPVLLPTSGDVGAMAFSSDSSLIAGGVGKTLFIWDPTTQELLKRLDLDISGDILDVLFGLDTSWIALGTSRDMLYIVDTATGEVTATLEGHSDDVSILALSPDGTLLASGSKDKTVKLWNTSDFTEITTLEGHEGYIGGLQFSPDGATLYVGDSKSAITLWDIATGGQWAVWEPEKGSYVVDMALTSDGGTLLVGEANNGSVRLWDVASGTEAAIYPVHVYPEINSYFATVAMALSPDDARIATLGSAGMLRIWDAATGENLITSGDHPDEAWSVAFNPDSTQLSTSYDHRIWRVWDPATYEVLHFEMNLFRIGFSDNRTSNVYSPDGTQIATRSAFEIKVYDAATWTMRYEYKMNGHSSVIYNADGSLLIVVGNALAVLDAATGEELAKFENHTHQINSVAINADQTLIATASDDGTVRLWGLPE